MLFEPGQHVRIKIGALQQVLRKDGTFTPFGESVIGAPKIAYDELGGHTAEVLESLPEQKDDLVYVLVRGRTRRVAKKNAFYRTEDLELI